MNIYLIAKKLSHSFSKPIHNALADYSYEYKELNEDELEEFFENYRRTVVRGPDCLCGTFGIRCAAAVRGKL